MDDQARYQIEIQGRVDEEGLNDTGPLQVSRVKGDEGSTVFDVADGSIGIDRAAAASARARSGSAFGPLEDPTQTPPQINDENSQA